MTGLAANYNLLNCHTKLCLMPEPGPSLAMANQMSEPITEDTCKIQMNLEKELTDLRCHTKHINDYVGHNSQVTKGRAPEKTILGFVLNY